ncbi:Fpg/Nei family DNA glycosylase [Actinobacteria bacterium YIM 96077]|uniref:DNA-(apurinic or apyrimidinic site) lyase n=1 Tax=Phytoactinopolyspora halophila TaxID=1981511 RepID=A0A329R3J8_9ACTN|nr:DNA-formamidopyrimidine glycosylase family protein [Phytoactinopolyspora halophila]AYY12166.1 Fpg/Nei family DNA glycosylase [Actinobacteria bacterium YIM 96077]RAW18599.1 Fpg/Nei family DNA glycosylase [Phytoactinopolyspora halophila]
MPEGHTIHRLAGELQECFGGTTVSVTSPQGRFAEGAALVDGSQMASAQAHGKHLFLEFVRGSPPESCHRRWVHVHLGLYGKLAIHAHAAGPPVGAVRMRLQTPTAHADLRGPTSCRVLDEAEKAAVHDRLGADPVRGDDPTAALARIHRSRSPIGVLLMDQSVIAGVGNVYRAEVLFRAGIDPARPGCEIHPDVLQDIWADLTVLMKAGVETGRIDTVRAEHEPDAMGRPPRVDDHGGEVYVYRRRGQPCHACGTDVRRREAAGRNVFWCPRCQG